MAVHAQYLTHAFPHDLRSIRAVDSTSAAFFEESGHLLGGGYNNQQQQLVVGNTVFSDPHSDLTCNNNNNVVSGKRARLSDDGSMDHRLLLPPVPQLFVSSGDLQSRVVDSCAASTSGRTANVAPISHGLLSHLYHQSVEIDAFVRFQNERLRTGLEEARRRHVRAVVSAVERAASRRMREAETELERARGRNAELEEKVRQMSAEGQVWLGMAKNHEAVASGLRATLDQLLQAPGVVAGDGADEGEAEDAQSCCFETAADAEEVSGGRSKKPCKACGEREVCVLLLPCRHLCLCSECEAAVDTCPVCASMKNASLHVLLS